VVSRKRKCECRSRKRQAQETSSSVQKTPAETEVEKAERMRNHMLYMLIQNLYEESSIYPVYMHYSIYAAGRSVYIWHAEQQQYIQVHLLLQQCLYSIQKRVYIYI